MRCLILAPFLLAAVSPFASAHDAAELGVGDGMTTIEGPAFGTRYTVKIAEELAGPKLQDVRVVIVEIIREFDEQMSLWYPESSLSRFNEHPGGEWFDVPTDVVNVVAAAIDMRTSTGGAFDPTIKPLLSVWGFGAQESQPRLPSDEEIEAARRLTGAVIETRLEPEPGLRKLQEGVQLDLNAIAKGYAVDRFIEAISERTDAGMMVEIGGEVRTRGTKPDGSPWRIAIEQPITGERRIGTAIELNAAALATSGDYRNYFEIDGQRYSHTIDPRTGRPVTHNLASVSVIADDCMTADAWATALMVLGPEEGYELAQQEGTTAYFIVREGDTFTSRSTAGFPLLIELSTPAAQSSRGASTWSTILLAAAVFGIAVAAMAIGVILTGRRLRGSCGGLSGLKDEQGNPLCDACTTPAEECDEFRKQVAATSDPKLTS